MQAGAVWRWRNTASLEEKKGIWFPDGARIYAVDQTVGPQKGLAEGRTAGFFKYLFTR
ncbi:hypothetical protein ALQ20_102040 [Pseudomonas syringae pv. atrofaciens]|uniref:Uncharacterized protein n=1 Tax=Pseudomonas coronafaciens pv. striafaciens TaxID=235276 RepID=A0A3M4YUY1_9PSED|nr:hypothetical protein ALQ96_101350 [Pseudomonas syringae pv. atrofaciens]RMM57555.1 hypothetical protein ALQ76_101691 [Pseudomonas syringae pv. atrofaciens]RMP65291.1 hypothetical protein ALQ20_102040 [Pseudomonas syringae pv. atrofaciens]RMR92508.1 hypothetical protein ALP78_101473 [Pseudomonas coronafaciens pv. striafaciens]RMU65695.1 hypothetical protein ALP25_101337 [Pseudomonas syringae pv. syringae]